MYPRSSLREKAFAIGGIVSLCGLVSIFWLDDHSNSSRVHVILRTVAAACFLFGWLAFHAGFFMRRWVRNPGIRAIYQNPDGVFWLRIAAVVLFLGVLPLVCLWAYHSIRHLRP
jgi:hypothetical protein